MNKLFKIFLAVASLIITSCNEEEETYMVWKVDNLSPDHITCDSENHNGVAYFTITVDGNGGDLVMICENARELDSSFSYLGVYDKGWGTFSIQGTKLICHFPVDNSGKQSELEHFTVSASIGGQMCNTSIRIVRTFGEPSTNPGTEELPDKYKFKLVKGALIPFMNDDFGAPAPFDNISYRITDYYERYQVFGFPEFTHHYDSIVWCADGFPNTVRVYERQNGATSTEEHFSSQFSTYFFKSGEIKNQLKGYRDGKVVYSTTSTTYLYERDFLCYDWIEGSFAIANPSNHGIYCLLDQRYEYTAMDTQIKNGTRYGRIGARNANGLSDMQESLIKLMTDNIGQPQSATGKTGQFKCIPSEGVEAIKFWENKTTRILLLHQLPVEDSRREKYYLHCESK